MQNFGNDGDGDPPPDWDQNTKNVRFNEGFDEEAAAMAVDSNPTLNLSWKDKLLGGKSRDVSMTMVNGIPTIAFSGRIKEILFKDMELTIVLKLLGRSIGYNALHNRILSLWKPAKPFHLMDITNGYFLVKFQDNEDYNRVLTQGQ
ncbi:hypothetical protein Golob_018354 [Gossypium lobatum]|uniref:DUF4283 domain-containing protein n=1 Tax=Gossypium lobatum TaxID=34289 RepID=A0A7J8MA04_9ROSI|nr:hypothetical protein [Gossypium lobatum]